MADKQNVLIEKERVRTAREALNASGGHIDNNQVDSNRNVVVSEQERWEELSNANMRVGHTVRRATADEPPRATGQHLNSDQYVNKPPGQPGGGGCRSPEWWTRCVPF